jgi:hypothetical protein
MFDGKLAAMNFGEIMCTFHFHFPVSWGMEKTFPSSFSYWLILEIAK